MKANAPKREVFQDAVDLISPENVADNGQAMISVEKIVPFHNHPFRLYEGKCLDDMVESVREHGILIPVIVQKIADGYEMLSGHNRWNAAKIAGITEIPAIIKEDLTEREAYVYVIETNMLQRSFDDLLPSEKAAVLAERYEKVMCQGRRNDILEEIAMLNGVDMPETCGHDVHKSKSRDSIGEDYGMTGRNITRYMRLNQTTDQIKEELKPKAEMAIRGEGSFCAGEWCQFCRAAVKCRARTEEKLKIAQEEFKLPPLLTDEEIEELLPILPDITKWANDIAAYALESAVHHGKEWNGYKVVEGRSNRKYSDEDAVAKAAKEHGYTDIYKQSLINIT